MALGPNNQMLKWGSDWYQGIRDVHDTFEVTISDGTYSVAINATIGQTVWEVDVERDIHQRWESRDFIVKVDELILNSVVVEPARGWTITETRDGVDYVYMVLAPPGEPEFLYDDDFRNSWRIHSKLRDEV